jgi:ketosteroid isomerase-like protein
VSEDFVNEHTSERGHSRHGRAAYRAALQRFLAEFADLRYEIAQVLVDGDRAAVEYRMSFRMLPAEGRPVSVRGVFLFRVDAAGLIAHRIDFWDSAVVDRQLR